MQPVSTETVWAYSLKWLPSSDLRPHAIASFSMDITAKSRPLRENLNRILAAAKPKLATPHAVINHINFSMMAATVTWIYGARLENTPERRHKVKGRNSFAFSDLRHIIAKAALSEDFDSVCHKQEKLSRKSFVTALLHMAA